MISLLPKLTPHQQCEAIERRDRGGESLADIGRSYNVSGSMISRLMHSDHRAFLNMAAQRAPTPTQDAAPVRPGGSPRDIGPVGVVRADQFARWLPGRPAG
jgi:hypothetical protein